MKNKYIIFPIFFLLTLILCINSFASSNESFIEFYMVKEDITFDMHANTDSIRINSEKNNVVTSLNLASSKDSIDKLISVFENIDWDYDRKYESEKDGYEIEICKNGDCEKYKSNTFPEDWEYFNDGLELFMEEQFETMFIGIITIITILIVIVIIFCAIFFKIIKKSNRIPRKIQYNKNKTFIIEGANDLTINKQDDMKIDKSSNFIKNERRKEKSKKNPFEID